MSNAQSLLDLETKRIIEDSRRGVSGFYKHTVLDLDGICKHHDIELLEGEFEDDNQSGALIRDGKKWQIIVNKNHSLNRKRFTIAHELGHYFAVVKGSAQAEVYFEKHNEVIKDYALMKRTNEVEEDSYQIERQANMIAAAILMPEEMVQKFYHEGLSLTSMAEKFGVSETAMSYKLESMGIDTLESTYFE